MKRKAKKAHVRKSIFRALFVPLFLIMVLQAVLFYVAAAYGNIEDTLTQNAADMLNERVSARKTELNVLFNNRWTRLEGCAETIDKQYAEYEKQYGSRPLTSDAQLQIDFLADNSELLITTLRQNGVNGIFLILNDKSTKTDPAEEPEQKYGICIRDLDQSSNYTGTEDLLLERAPSSIIDRLNCSLDSWWEAKYTFSSTEKGDYYYLPVNAAWDNPGAESKNLAYCSGIMRLSTADQAMIAYSIPLTDTDGYPYAVLGVEISTKYLASLLPNKELSVTDRACYMLATRETASGNCVPIVGTGQLYIRCFGGRSVVSCGDTAASGGFWVTGGEDIRIYGEMSELDIYNNNSPFESRSLTLVGMVERGALFGHIDRIKLSLMLVSAISLLLGIAGIALVSRQFAAPITALAKRVRSTGDANKGSRLGRLGIYEIDQLVDSIEELNINVSKNSARTEFFSRMSHDMRTPMNAIIGFSSPELLENADENLKDEYLKKINTSGGFLLGLINEVLDITKIESDKTELRLETVSAKLLFDATLPIIEEIANKKDVVFLTDISVPPGLFIKVDRQHINQIVMNLLSNAVKFTTGGGRVVFSLAITDDPADVTLVNCRIKVEDTGIGMSEKFMKNLYTPFEQENSEKEGTGLGLSIAYKLIELMNGTINCVSSKNVGTAFTVELPLLRDTATAAVPPVTGQTASSASFKNRRILIFEDNALNSEIIRRLLEKTGAQVTTAENGREGVDIFTAADVGYFDAILMDMQMPVMDGVTATKTIRSLERADATLIPIIAMTANAFDEDVQACMNAGMNAHIAKPLEPGKLFSTLTGFIGETP